ncbi:DUF3553 domain-containing protein [Geomonas sp. RF6]|uniref:DUF3553 domain-containing protein n=1 Tax=Geomonas sp. RF6 TaxID=2897342 RepID=UPI001E5821B0|nr:DUF3553 domain-containing protein [Geomonas sp. RF6]UFS72094.1 DUF3553 domain-containing protein [Geomonas sp. RF6]
MIIKRGSVISHTVAKEWGVGKVIEVNDLRAVIQFNDGSVRKIISSHFFKLEAADNSLYHPPTDTSIPLAVAAPKRPKKVKAVV